MVVDDDSIISYRERKREKDNKNNYELISVSKRGSENMIYISVRGRYYTSNPGV